MLSSVWKRLSAHAGPTLSGFDMVRMRIWTALYSNSEPRNGTTRALPPIWASVEVMSLGQISRWFANLLHAADRNAIAEPYGIDEVLLASFLHHIREIGRASCRERVCKE